MSSLSEPTHTGLEVSEESLDLYYSGSKQIKTESSQLEPDSAGSFVGKSTVSTFKPGMEEFTL